MMAIIGEENDDYLSSLSPTEVRVAARCIHSIECPAFKRVRARSPHRRQQSERLHQHTSSSLVTYRPRHTRVLWCSVCWCFYDHILSLKETTDLDTQIMSNLTFPWSEHPSESTASKPCVL